MKQKKLTKELIDLIQCPISKTPLYILSKDEILKIPSENSQLLKLLNEQDKYTFLINQTKTFIYLVEYGIPIIESTKAIPIKL